MISKEIVIAYMDGQQIEQRCVANADWQDKEPYNGNSIYFIDDGCEYRIKPKPRYQVLYRTVDSDRWQTSYNLYESIEEFERYVASEEDTIIDSAILLTSERTHGLIVEHALE